MPELPDIAAYLVALEPRVVGQPLVSLRLASPFLLRSVDPSPREAEGRKVVGLRRLETHVRQEADALLETYRAALGLA